MFTGLVEETAVLAEVLPKDFGARLRLAPPSFVQELAPGDSLALNGCCLTVADTASGLSFDLLQETLYRTNLGQLAPGQRINLERALRWDSRLGGHFVQGHVDTTSTVLIRQEQGDNLFLSFALAEKYASYLVEKGSICVNGVSLTVATLQSDQFGVWIIPHTRAATNLGDLQVGDYVNLEFDVLAKYVQRFWALRSPAGPHP